MKAKFFGKVILVATLGFFMANQAHAGLYHVFRAAAVMPIQVEAVDKKGDTVLMKKTLGTKDLVNLALGMPLNHKIPSNYVFALAYNISDQTSNKLIVFDTNSKSIVATVASTQSLPAGTLQSDKEKVKTEKGSGVAVVTFLKTPSLGANGIVENTTVFGAAEASWTPTEKGPIFGMKATALFGPMVVRITDPKTDEMVEYDGIVVRGMFQTKGVALEHHLFLPD